MTTATTTVADFILARVEADEQVARACVPGPWSVSKDVEVRGNGGRNFVATTTGAVPSDNGAHIARHDPARVLAQCAAYRAIVEEHARGGYRVTRVGDGVRDVVTETNYTYCPCAPDGDDWPCPTLRALASIWADHPEWREEWANV